MSKPSPDQARLKQNVPGQICSIFDRPLDDAPYSSFNKRQKALLAYAASISAMFSGLSSFIYYPAITALANDLHKSITSINLTITIYLVMAGLAPSIFGDMAEKIGRRPVSLMTLSLYFCANLGLAVQDDYVALLALRCLQSAGASSTIALAYGIISDISTPAERGSYMGILMGFTNAAPSIGPVLGGLLAERLTWHWIFWILCILSGAHLLVLLIFLPETSRKLVGDGSLQPTHWMNKSIYSVRFCSDSRSNMSYEAANLSFPNPSTCLIALFDRSNSIVIVAGGLQYTVFGCLAASLSTQMIGIYSLNYLTAGLVYLPPGIGGILAAFSTGKLLDYEYRITARKYNLPISRSENDITRFPIEEARLRSVFCFLVVSSVATAGYGWAVHTKTSIAAPVIMQFITGGSSVAIFVICGGLLTDLNPQRSATVQASYNLVRCALGAAGVAALQPLVDAVGAGWSFTVFAMVGILCIPSLLLLRFRGQSWRQGLPPDLTNPTMAPINDREKEKSNNV